MRLEYKYVILEEQVGLIPVSMSGEDRGVVGLPVLNKYVFQSGTLDGVLWQVWTKQEDDESEGVIELSYRSSDEPFQPPDVKTIRKKMAIVDWQPGPNRMLEVPTEVSPSYLAT